MLRGKTPPPHTRGYICEQRRIKGRYWMGSWRDRVEEGGIEARVLIKKEGEIGGQYLQ